MVRHGHTRVDLSIDSDLWEVFKTEMSVGKPFTYKGLISEEAEEAFRNHIILKRKSRSNTQHAAQLHHEPELWTMQNKIIDFMKDEGLWEKYAPFIQEAKLKQVIHEIRHSTDHRVPKKWINRLLQHGLIERSTLHRYKLNILDEEKAGLTQTVDNSLDKVSRQESKVNEQPTIVRE